MNQVHVYLFLRKICLEDTKRHFGTFLGLHE